MAAGAKTVTILFTDLVGSTELLQRAGDEQAQRIFRAHHRLLSEAVQQHGGHEVKWLGDGLMVAFDSAQEAVKCAIAMQQASRRPAAGERLEIRAGLNVGEALVEESDYFGTPVVVARRLCDKGGAGQIFASDVVVRLLGGRGADIDVKELGPLELKGITNPVPAVEIVYQHDPMALLRKLPFVGRQAEYEMLLKKLAEAQNGSGSVVLLAGEPGIGKTRLTEEFCDHASSSATVIRANCYEGEVAPPFGPWLEALRSLVEQLKDKQLRDAAGPGAADIAVLIPEIRRRLPDLDEPPKLDPESERGRLFGSILAFLRQAGEQRALIIFLDDLQWSDRPSLALLEYVARGIADRRVVIIGTYREMEVDRVHPLAQTLASLRRLDRHERIVLRGMRREEVDTLLAAIEPSEESKPIRRVLSAALSRETEGNPLFIWEVVTHLIEAGKIVHEGGRWTSHVETVADLGIPEGVREAIGRRLSRLSEGCNRVLQRASALTGGFTWEELQAICEESEDELLDYLDEALGAQLIAERSRGEYGFTHALIRATLYEELSTPRRVRLHGRIAAALETLYADRIDDHLGEMAGHYMASTGGDAEKAIDYSVRAGDRAKELFAWEEAAAHYQRALDAMPEAGDEERRSQVSLDLGKALTYMGQPSDAVAAYRQAAELGAAVGSAELLAEAASGFEEAGYFIQGDARLPKQRLDLIDEALEALGSADSALRARLLAQRTRAAAAVAATGGGEESIRFGGAAAFFGSQDPQVLLQAREAVAIAERLGDAAVIASTLDFLAQYMLGPVNEEEQLAICEKLVRMAREGGDGRFELSGLNWLFNLTVARGDMVRARELHAEAGRRSKESKIGWAIWQDYGREAMLVLAEGRLEEGERAVFEALEYGQSINHPSAELTFGAQLSILRFYQGRLGELEEMFRGIVEGSPGVGVYRGGLALLLAETGKTEEAKRVLEAMTADGFADLPEDSVWVGAVAILCEACARLQHRDAAADLYKLFSKHSEGNATIGLAVSLGAIAGYLGQMATLLERWDDAERHFQDALDLNEKMGHRPALAQTRLNCGEMLLRRGRPDDRGRAVALLNEAVAFANQSGMGTVQRGSERLLGQLALAGEPEPAP